MDNKTTLIALAGFGAGLIVGGVSTYLTVKKTFENRANRDIAEVRAMYLEKLSMVPKEYVTNQTDFLIETHEHNPLTEPERQELIIEGQNIIGNQGYWGAIQQKAAEMNSEPQPMPEFFRGSDAEKSAVLEDPDTDTTITFAKVYEKIEGKPYIISRHEFEDNTVGHDQKSLTYYEGDFTLADENGGTIGNEEDSLVGTHHYDWFGYGSDDPNIVYVRNDLQSIDIEIIRNPGDYTKLVLGLSDEDLGEKTKPKVMKMRNHD